MRYLLTHSLLSAWQYALKNNSYEDATTDDTAYDNFIFALHRLPTLKTEAMENGIEFEDLVTDILAGEPDVDKNGKWYDCAFEISRYLYGGVLQCKVSKPISVDGIDILLYGRLDCLKGGVISDIKFSKKYERGKYINSTQHPVYFELVPEAYKFVYRISDGNNVWTEEYRREETPSIIPVISDFIKWLKVNDLFEIYTEKWQSEK